ncbi:MAG TPA: hypothetical protein VHD87_08380 [Acidimicrobiales bacterium]|nr:hypothetical protein [Acidimicrobiales bacterium]
MDFQPQRRHELLAVYPDQETADHVIEELKRRFYERDVHEGTDQDRRDSLNAEMSDEMRASFAAPQVGVIYPKEAMKTAAWMMPLFIAVGMVIMLPIALAVHGSHLATGTRVVAGLLIGAALGATMALILMGLGEKNPDEAMAAERGVVVRVGEDRDDLRSFMLESHPIRLDVVDDRGRPIQTIATEPDTSLEPRTQGKRETHWP